MIFLKNLQEVDFIPYNRYGERIENIYWHNINYSDETGIGSYILKFNPSAKTKYHKHVDDENFFVIEGEITDSISGETYKKGNYISLEKGSEHYSYSEKGCVLLIFSQGHIERC